MSPWFISNPVPGRERNTVNSEFFTTFRSLKPLQIAHFLVTWFAWTCDAFDFFAVSLTLTRLSELFDVSSSKITAAITLTLFFRSAGAVIFGVLSDRFGRKWPLVVNLLLCSLFSLATGSVNTYSQFLAVRSLFGIAMGGIWGLASSSALENLPVEVRGLASGILQQGYAVGYLTAAVVNLIVVPRSLYTWRTLFWFGGGVSFLAAILRLLLPESEVFLRDRAIKKVKGGTTSGKTGIFLHEIKEMLKLHWKLCIYVVLFMSGFSFLAHGSQDLYPTYLQTTKGFSVNDATIATIIGNCASGAIAGGVVAGASSQYIGRRLTIIIAVLLVGAFIPLWVLPNTFSPLAAGAFCVQFGVQGAFGVIPIHLTELSPPAFRAMFPGVAYQLGNMVSSASSLIETTAGNQLRTSIIVNGHVKNVPDYAKVQGIFIGVVVIYVVLVTIVGPEYHSSHFEIHTMTSEESG